MNELKLVAEARGIKSYESMSEDELLNVLNPLKETKISFFKAKVEEIRKKFNESRHKFSKLKIKEIRKNLYEIENEKNPSVSKIKEIEKNLTELEENLSKTNKYCDYDDAEYRGIRDVKDLFDLSISEDYYKPIIVNGAFNNNYIQDESKGDRDKILTISEYLDMIRPYLVDMINDHKNQSEWKIQLTVAINFISSKPDSDETRIMHTKSNNIEIMIGSDTNGVIKELFKSLLQRYQEHLETKMSGSEFVFDAVNVLYYDLNKISLNRGGSYIDSPEWIKNKKVTINPNNNDDKCFQYALTVALNHQNVKTNPQRITKIEPFIDLYNWKEIDFPSQGKDWKKFEPNNKSIALNILYVPHNTKKICHAYKSKYNSTRENQAILLMITDGKKWHYLAVTRLSSLLKGITSKHNGDFYCLNCFRAYTTRIRLERHKNVCENHNYCRVEMPNEDNKILKYNYGEKSMKAPFIIYADLEPLLEKMSTCYDAPEKSSTTKINKHTPSGYSLFTHCSFDETKTKIYYYRGLNCMKNFCLDLKKHATKIINYEKKKKK